MLLGEVEEREKNVQTPNSLESHIKDGTTHNMMSSSAATNPVSVLMNPAAMYEYAASIVSHVVSHGWGGTVPPGYPYQAMLQIATVMCDFLQSQNQTSLVVPHFVAEVIVALMVQDTNHNGMLVNYKARCDFLISSFQSRGNLGPNPRYINFDIPTNTYVNNFWPEVVNPGPYDAEIAATALQSLWTFVDDLGRKAGIGRYAMVSVIELYTKTMRDGSAFGWNISSVGGDSAGSGGMSVISNLESPMRKPQLACWNLIPTSGLPSLRASAYTNTSSASPAFLGSYPLQNVVPWSTKKKVGPIYHPLDFGETLLRISLWLQMAAQISADDIQNQNIPIGDYTLPITVQNFAIMFRQVLVSICNPSQQAGQFVWPYTSSAPSLFMPLVVGPNLGPLGMNGAGPLLPQSIYENLYAITLTNAFVRGNKPSGRIYAPLVGFYDSLYPALESLTITRGESTVPLFMAPETKLAKNGKDRVMIDVTINLVDGTYPGNKIAQLNYSDSILLLAATWNKYLDRLIRPFSSVLCGPSPDGGIRALKLPGAFAFAQVANNQDLIDMKKKMTICGFKYADDPYMSSVRRSINATSEMLATGQDFFSAWQYPIWYSNSGASPIDNETLIKLRVYGRTMVLLMDDPLKGTSIFTIALQNATQNVKARNGEATTADEILKQFAIMGDGSILPLVEALLTGAKVVGSLLGGRPRSNMSPVF